MKKICIMFFVFPWIAFGQWSNTQDAQYVIGEPDFTTKTSGCSTQQLNNPGGCAVNLTTNKIYISDTFNHRVLRFSYPITSSYLKYWLLFDIPRDISLSLSHVLDKMNHFAKEEV